MGGAYGVVRTHQAPDGHLAVSSVRMMTLSVA